MGVVARLAYARARSRGIATRTLLRKSRLTVRQIEDPNSRLPVRDQLQFLNLAAEALGDDMLGFNLAKEFDLRQGGIFYYVLASSESLQEVFERAARYSTVVNEGFVQRFIDSRRMGLGIQYAGVSRQSDRHQIEFWLVTLVRICRQLTGMHVKPARVRLVHQRGRGHARLSNYFDCTVEFGATRDEILFAQETRELRVVGADPFLNRLLISICEEQMSRRLQSPETFRARVENAVAPLLPHGAARASEIANRLGLSQRTFARRLADEGLTFSRLVLQLRQQLARRYLVQEKLAVSKVAWLLGYQEVATFSHAFRRWTGKSPSAFVRRAR